MERFEVLFERGGVQGNVLGDSESYLRLSRCFDRLGSGLHGGWRYEEDEAEKIKLELSEML